MRYWQPKVDSVVIAAASCLGALGRSRISLLVWTFRHLGRNLTDTVVTRKGHTLVTTGPYRFVRHPFYSAFAVALVGGSLVTANWFIFLSGCVPLAFLVSRTRIEEEKLTERFGDEYKDYMASTGRFLPRLRIVESSKPAA